MPLGVDGKPKLAPRLKYAYLNRVKSTEAETIGTFFTSQSRRLKTSSVLWEAGVKTYSEIEPLSKEIFAFASTEMILFSAKIKLTITSVNNDKNLPTLESPPLLRENRLYQADWLLRFYGFTANELLDETHPNFNNILDPKCDWALRHLNNFPVEINTASYHTLLRVPGIGVISAKKIIRARRSFSLTFEALTKLGVSLKRAQYFITCRGKYFDRVYKFNQTFIETNLIYQERNKLPKNEFEQLSLFDNLLPTKEDKVKCLTGNL